MFKELSEDKAFEYMVELIEQIINSVLGELGVQHMDDLEEGAQDALSNITREGARHGAYFCHTFNRIGTECAMANMVKELIRSSPDVDGSNFFDELRVDKVRVPEGTSPEEVERMTGRKPDFMIKVPPNATEDEVKQKIAEALLKKMTGGIDPEQA